MSGRTGIVRELSFDVMKGCQSIAVLSYVARLVDKAPVLTSPQ